jgi:hypothetical protein
MSERLVRSERSNKIKMETWLSGRKHLTANEAGSKSPPGFESLRLRNSPPKCEYISAVCYCVKRRDSKAGSGIQDERNEVE